MESKCNHTLFTVAVRGPEFRRIKVGVGHRLDASSSGVLGEVAILRLRIEMEDNSIMSHLVDVLCLQILLQIILTINHLYSLGSVIGVGRGNKLLNDLYQMCVTRVSLFFFFFAAVVLRYICI